MIGVERLARVLAITGASRNVIGGDPISVNLIGPSDGGKTALILSHLPAQSRVLNGFTSGSLLNTLNVKDPPTTIVCPDFNRVVSHKPYVTGLTISTLLSLMAEGVTEIPGLEGPAKLIADQLNKRGVRISMLTGMTPDVFFASRGKWRSTGFLRRIVPIYYSYSGETISKVQKGIQAGSGGAAYDHVSLKDFTPKKIAVPASFAKDAKCLSESVIAHQLTWKTGTKGRGQDIQAHDLPFSLHLIFRTYLKAAALVAGRSTVTQRDADALHDFARFVRYSQPESL